MAREMGDGRLLLVIIIPKMEMFLSLLAFCDSGEHKVSRMQNGALLGVIAYLKTILKVSDLIRQIAIIEAYSITGKDRCLDTSSPLCDK